MRAWLCDNPIGVEALRWTELPTPEPGPGQVRIAVHAASLNFPDLLMLKGEYQFRPEPPFTVGMDLAGVIDAVGQGVKLKPGARVAGGAKTGAFADYAISPANNLHPIPDTMASPLAAAYPAAYVTAYVSLVERGQLALVVHHHRHAIHVRSILETVALVSDAMLHFLDDELALGCGDLDDTHRKREWNSGIVRHGERAARWIDELLVNAAAQRELLVHARIQGIHFRIRLGRDSNE